jgi:hypothetical protein
MAKGRIQGDPASILFALLTGYWYLKRQSCGACEWLEHDGGFELKKRYLIVLLVFGFAFGACESEGINVTGSDSKDTGGNQPDAVTTEDSAVEDAEPEVSGPPFENTLAWKVLNPGDSVVWNTITGKVNDDGSYVVFVAGGFGSIAWLDSASGKWSHLNMATTESINSIWVDGPDYVAVCGEKGLLKRYYDFSETENPDWYNDDIEAGLDTELEHIDGYDRKNLWAVGQDGAAAKYDGENWTVFTPQETGLATSPPPDLNGVLALGPEKALIVADGLFITYNAGAFEVNEADFEDYKLSTLVEADDGIWLAGDKGTVFRSKSEGGWDSFQANVYSQFRSLWVSPSGTVWTAGTQTDGTLWYYDGNPEDDWKFEAVDSPKFIKDQYPDRTVKAQTRIAGIWGTDDQNIYVCTLEKQVVHFAVHP